MKERIADLDALPPAPDAGKHPGLWHVLGSAAWLRLPAAVRARFTEDAPDATYAGAFEVVSASALGRFFAWLGALVGTPVVPRTGEHVEARVEVRARRDGIEWRRHYRWGNRVDVVTSTKVVEDGRLIERLPACLNMPLDVREENGVLVFESRGYYFEFRMGELFRLRLPLPAFFSPGQTRVEHVDLGNGWFRFTLIVTHPWFGQMFFQTGRFCATED
ncbi:MAG TPA: DUF4166 domain-containing protein [Steroidobacteraceae bacterium]|nr:DUF4166 domain-containing protein [Steroidobacteraceae bacterium]